MQSISVGAAASIKPYLDVGETALGTRVDVRHLAATPAGRRVTGEAKAPTSMAIHGQRLFASAQWDRRPMSEYTDNCDALGARTTLLIMDDMFYKTLQHLYRGDALITSGVNGLIDSWQASTEVIGKLCTGHAERWQATIRKIQAPVNLAEILRARTSCWSDT